MTTAPARPASPSCRPRSAPRPGRPEPLVALTKANSRSTVHRATYLDYVGVKRFGPDGLVVGEHRFLGLFTSAAYSLNPRSIPLLRRKVALVEERSGFSPKRPLRQGPGPRPGDLPARRAAPDPRPTSCWRRSREILHLQDRQKLRLFVRSDAYARFASCLVYVPRDRYNTAFRERIQRLLEEALGGTRERVPGPARRIDPGPPAVHHPHAQRHAGRLRCRGAGAAAGRGLAGLGRAAARRPDRDPWRGGRQPPLRPLRPRRAHLLCRAGRPASGRPRHHPARPA